MRYILKISSIPDITISVKEKHEKVIKALNTLGSEWGIKSETNILMLPGKINEDKIINIGKYLKWARGSIYYVNRNNIEDDHFYDDRIYLEINAKKLDVKTFIDEIFPIYIKLFDAYLGVFKDEEFIFKDFDLWRGINSRQHILRFSPVFYFDEVLAKRAIGKTVAEIYDILLPHVKIVNNGLMLGLDNRLPTMKEADEFNLKITTLLNLPSLI